MKNSDLKKISDTLLSYNLGPGVVTRRIWSRVTGMCDDDGSNIDIPEINFTYNQEPRLFFTIVEHKIEPDYFGYIYSLFSTAFPKVDESQAKHSLAEIISLLTNWIVRQIGAYKDDLQVVDPWDQVQEFTPPLELTSGIQTIDFDSEEDFTEEEQRLIESDLNKTQEFIRNEVGLEDDRLAAIEKDIAEIKQELSKRSKFSWKEYAREKLIDELVNTAKDRLSLMQLYKLFEFLGPFDLPQLGS